MREGSSKVQRSHVSQELEGIRSRIDVSKQDLKRASAKAWETKIDNQTVVALAEATKRSTILHSVGSARCCRGTGPCR